MILSNYFPMSFVTYNILDCSFFNFITFSEMLFTFRPKRPQLHIIYFANCYENDKNDKWTVTSPLFLEPSSGHTWHFSAA